MRKIKVITHPEKLSMSERDSASDALSILIIIMNHKSTIMADKCYQNSKKSWHHSALIPTSYCYQTWQHFATIPHICSTQLDLIILLMQRGGGDKTVYNSKTALKKTWQFMLQHEEVEKLIKTELEGLTASCAPHSLESEKHTCFMINKLSLLHCQEHFLLLSVSSAAVKQVLTQQNHRLAGLLLTSGDHQRSPWRQCEVP